MFYQIVISILIMFLCALFAKAAPAEAEKNKVKHVELQWVLCEDSAESVLKKTNTKNADSTQNDAYYYETRTMDLFAHRSFVRVRAEGPGLKSTAKVNYPDARNLPWDLLKDQDSKCEWDQYPDFKKVGCSLNTNPSDLDKVLSQEQKEFIARETGFNDFQNLVKLGPAHTVDFTWNIKHVPADLVLEQTTAPGYLSLELSTRVDLKEADDTKAEVNQWIQKNSLKLCPKQQGKGEALLRALLNP